MPSDQTLPRNGSASRAWLIALIPIIPSVLIIAALWGAFGQRLTTVEDAQRESTRRLNDMDKVIVDLRIAVSNLTVEVASLNATLRQHGGVGQ